MGDAAQGTTAALIHEIFNIPTGFQGTIISAFARLHLDSVVDDVNDETLDPWAELQRTAGITQTTPLNPFMEKELLKDTDLSLDGSAFVRTMGFEYVLWLKYASCARRPISNEFSQVSSSKVD